MDSSEQCDDDGVARFDGCSDVCAIEGGFSCSGQPSTCSVVPSPQSKAQQSCIVSMNKAAAKVAAVWFTEAGLCMSNASTGRTDRLGAPATAQDCLSNDPRGKLGLAEGKLAR